MSNVEITIPGPNGNDLLVEGRMHISLDPAVKPMLVVDEILSIDEDGEELALTLHDFMIVCIMAESLIIAEESRLLAKFLDSQD